MTSAVPQRRLAIDGPDGWIFGLDPIARAAGMIARGLPLRDDAFAAQRQACAFGGAAIEQRDVFSRSDAPCA
jgi:hypothetical protein